MRLLIALVGSDAGISFWGALGMRLRGTLKPEVVYPIISAARWNLDVPVYAIEAHFLSGGDTQAVTNACILLDRAGLPFDFHRLAACDLAGWDALAMAQALLEARRQFPELEFAELSRRRSLGEDVVAEIEKGTFVPDAQSDGWRVRFEHGPLTRDELEALVARGEVPRDALALRPGGVEWVPIGRLGLARPPDPD